jgi:indole-3-glycerol phosphate synthase
MTILQEIFAHKRLEIAGRKLEKTLAELRADVRRAPPPIDFCQALINRPHPALIAEIKRRSPSRGLLSREFDPLRLARIYQENGAAAISILTDEHYFGGGLDILSQVSDQIINGKTSRIPLLQKDFICDAYQVYEARIMGADAILLITACLNIELLSELHALALDLRMTPLVEVHNYEDLQKAKSIHPRLVGINNRDLRDFSVHMETIDSLRPHVPAGVLLVAESGIHTLEDVRHLEKIGVNAMLVGEALVTAGDIPAQVRCLSQVEEHI